jgi:glutamate-ammonia-ligase adenylyltransferase
MSDTAAIAEAAGGRFPEDAIRRHLASFPEGYRARFAPAEVAEHLDALADLGEHRPVRVRARAGAEPATWDLLVVGFDTFQFLATVCNLITVHGGSIVEARIFTSEPPPEPAGPPKAARRPPGPPSRRPATGGADRRRRLVDSFHVRQVDPDAAPPDWARFEGELAGLANLLRAGRYDDVNHDLIGRFVAVLGRDGPPDEATLPSLELTIDAEASAHATALHLRARDSLGFLSLTASALSLCGIRIAEADIRTVDGRAEDVLWVTDRSGRKIVAEGALSELRSSLILIEHFSSRLPHATDPEAALVHFSRFAAETMARPNWAADFEALDRPDVLDALVRVLGESDFLWEDYLHAQPENVVPLICDPAEWRDRRPPEDLRARLEAAVAAAGTPDEAHRALQRFKDREVFRIGVRAILGRCGGPEGFAAELTEVAEVLLRAALALACAEAPAPPDVPVALLALGKFGGRELGFGSDLELMLLFDDRAGGARAPGDLDAVVRALRRALGGREGGTFELDFRLRPYGKSGPPATSLAAFTAYYQPGGAAWSYERQALVKLRAIAGDTALGRHVEELRDGYVFGREPFDLAAMRDMRRLQVKQLVRPGRINAKYSPGALVDVEYAVQAYQMTHGWRDPALRSPNTLEALAALEAAGRIAPAPAVALREGYRFFRTLTDALRVVHGHSRDLTLPPFPSDAFGLLARRLRSGDPAALHDDVRRRLETTRAAVEALAAALASAEPPAGAG